MRKICALILFMGLLLMPCQVSEASTLANRYSADLTISSKGVASITVAAAGKTTVKKIQIVTYLQRFEASGRWRTITSWSKTTDSFLASFSKKHSLSRNGTYRVWMRLIFTGNGVQERREGYSATKMYS